MAHPTIRRASSATTTSDKFHACDGLVCRITNSVDYERDGYQSFEYAVLQPDGTWKQYDYSNEFRRYYESSYEGATQFEKFMTVLEECNPGFDMEKWQHTWDSRALVGMRFGAVFRPYYYASNVSDEVRSRPELAWACSVKQIQEGKYKQAKPRYQHGLSEADCEFREEPVTAKPWREAAQPMQYQPAPQRGGIYDEGLPF